MLPPKSRLCDVESAVHQLIQLLLKKFSKFQDVVAVIILADNSTKIIICFHSVVFNESYKLEVKKCLYKSHGAQSCFQHSDKKIEVTHHYTFQKNSLIKNIKIKYLVHAFIVLEIFQYLIGKFIKSQ